MYAHAVSPYFLPIRMSRIAAFTRSFAFEALAPSPFSAAESPPGRRSCILFSCIALAYLMIFFSLSQIHRVDREYLVARLDKAVQNVGRAGAGISPAARRRRWCQLCLWELVEIKGTSRFFL